MSFKRVGRHMHKQKAITLVELIIALSVLAILTAIASPGLTSLFQRIRMDNDVNKLMHSFHRARQNALVTGVATALCPSGDGMQCDDSRNWADGWVVFANTDGDEPPAIDPGEPILKRGGPSRNLRIQTNRRAYILRPFGLRSTNGTLTWCDGRGASYARALVISYTGKPRVSDTTASGQPLECDAAIP